MIGVILVTHGRLAEELRIALEHVVGEQERIKCVCIGADDDVEQRREDILKAVEEVKTQSGTIILTDMFGGTPSNLAISVMDAGRIDVVAGVNLPMLVKLAGVRETLNLEDAVQEIQDAGRKYINSASRILVNK